MPRFAYVNGNYVPFNQAFVHIEDRGFQFADGVYEVVSFINGNLADLKGHFDRLERSLNELDMAMPMDRSIFKIVINELIRRNKQKSAYVYIQVTRGVAKRDFAFPNYDVSQSVVITTRSFDFDNNPNVLQGIKVKTTPDIRWKRPDIKTVGLIGQVLAKQDAVNHGCTEAWLVDEAGLVTEGASSNAWIVDNDNNLITRNVDGKILRGVTRTALAYFCRHKLNLTLQERAFSVDECYMAKEAFTSSATALIMPVISIDEHILGNGKPGTVAVELNNMYRDYVEGNVCDQFGWEA